MPSDLFPLLFSAHETPSASSAFASCSLSSLCKVISGISSSGASLWLGLIYIRFQTGAMNCGFFVNFFSLLLFFCGFHEEYRSTNGRPSRGALLGEKEVALMLSSTFLSLLSLSFFLSLSRNHAAAAASFSLFLLLLFIPLFTQRVA